MCECQAEFGDVSRITEETVSLGVCYVDKKVCKLVQKYNNNKTMYSFLRLDKKERIETREIKEQSDNPYIV